MSATGGRMHLHEVGPRVAGLNARLSGLQSLDEAVQILNDIRTLVEAVATIEPAELEQEYWVAISAELLETMDEITEIIRPQPGYAGQAAVKRRRVRLVTISVA